MEPEVDGEIATKADLPGAHDRVTAYGWKALAGSVIGYSMDGFDLLIVGFILAAISSDLALAVGGAGPLVVGALAAKYSFHTAIALLVSIYAVDVIATIVFVPELKGWELE
jgi:hypothetical protein